MSKSKPKFESVDLDPFEHKAGKWVAFDFDNPKKISILVVKDDKVRIAVVEDKDDIAYILSKAKQSADGRYVGIFVKGGRLTVPGGKEIIKNAKGEAAHDPPEYKDVAPGSVTIPHSVAPQRTVLSADGARNLEWICEGQVMKVLFPLDSLKHVDCLLTRDDIPKHHDKTLHKNFDPLERLRR